MNFQVHCPVCSGEFDVEDRIDQDNAGNSQHPCPRCGALLSPADTREHQPELPVSGFHVSEPNDADLLELEEPSPDDLVTRTDPETSPSDPQSYSTSFNGSDAFNDSEAFNDSNVDLAPVAEHIRSGLDMPARDLSAGDLPAGDSPERDCGSAEEIAEPPAMAWNQLAARPRPQSKPQSALRKLLPPVLGGLTAIPIAIGILWYGFGRDLGNAGPTVARYVPWIVPKHLRGRSAGYTNRSYQNSTANKPANQQPKPNLDAGAFGKIGGGLSDPTTSRMESATRGSGVFGGMGGGTTSPNASNPLSEPPSSIDEESGMDIVAEATPPEAPEGPAEMIDSDATSLDEPSMMPMLSEPDEAPLPDESPLPSVRADSEQEMRIKPDDDLIPVDFGDSPTEVMKTEGDEVSRVIEGTEEPITTKPYAASIETEAEELLERLFNLFPEKLTPEDQSLENQSPENPVPDSPSPTKAGSLSGDFLCRQLAQLAIGLDAATGTPTEGKLRDRVGILATRILQSKSMRTAIEENALNRIALATPPEIGEMSVWISDSLSAIGEEPNDDNGGNLVIESIPSLMIQTRVARLVLDRNRTHAVERIPDSPLSNSNSLEEHQTTRASKLIFGKLLQWDETSCVVEIVAIFP